MPFAMTGPAGIPTRRESTLTKNVVDNVADNTDPSATLFTAVNNIPEGTRINSSSMMAILILVSLLIILAVICAIVLVRMRSPSKTKKKDMEYLNGKFRKK